jgi:hypothetical protein
MSTIKLATLKSGGRVCLLGYDELSRESIGRELEKNPDLFINILVCSSGKKKSIRRRDIEPGTIEEVVNKDK